MANHRAAFFCFRRVICRVVVAKSDDPTTMSAGEIVGIVEDRCVDDDIYKLPTPGHTDAATSPCGASLVREDTLASGSMVSACHGRTCSQFCPVEAGYQSDIDVCGPIFLAPAMGVRGSQSCPVKAASHKF